MNLCVFSFFSQFWANSKKRSKRSKSSKNNKKYELKIIWDISWNPHRKSPTLKFVELKICPSQKKVHYCGFKYVYILLISWQNKMLAYYIILPSNQSTCKLLFVCRLLFSSLRSNSPSGSPSLSQFIDLSIISIKKCSCLTCLWLP